MSTRDKAPKTPEVVMISGASSGIGKALALEMLRRGYSVSLSARREEVIEAYLAQTLSPQEVETRCLVVKTDVTVEEDCRQWVEKTVQKFGRIDILINNAGLSMRGLFVDCKTETLQRLMDTNFWGTVYCCKYALPHLLKKRGSSVVGISSIAGYQSLPARAAYSASKAAIQSLMQTLRIEHRRQGLHVMVACPGFTASHVRENALDKNGNPQGKTPREEDKMMTAERVAFLIARGIKHKRRALIMTPLGKITVFVEKFWPQLTEAVAYSYMSKEPDSPFK
ncbi:MAG: SDR family oxidoreductase [Bacteroides sp.]|nr:SDR family oxidoreductase [Ruminococcus flavefaciens]MCM1554746.1 SDR family oxidoreductase [Bacteroides sp.]